MTFFIHGQGTTSKSIVSGKLVVLYVYLHIVSGKLLIHDTDKRYLEECLYNSHNPFPFIYIFCKLISLYNYRRMW